MSLSIQPYRPEDEAEVEAFNERLQSGGAASDLVFYGCATPSWLPPTSGSALFNEFFVARDAFSVRGGYALKHQNFSFPDGTVRNIGYYHHPLSEGIVNKSHALVGSLLLRDAMTRSPLLYCLGMGGYDNPLPQMLIRLGWTHCPVPFYFRVLHPRRFLRQMQALRSSWWRKGLMDVGAFSGAGWVAIKTLGAIRKISCPPPRGYRSQEVSEFEEWADILWQRCRNAYGLTAVRDRATLQNLYPASDDSWTRLRITKNGQDVGWAVVAERRKDRKYGDLRVGSVVDCWSGQEDAEAVVHAASAVLADQGMDLIVSNQSHTVWRSAFPAAGFFQGPSSFIFAASKKLSELLHPFESTSQRMHFTRADGDGLPRNF